MIRSCCRWAGTKHEARARDPGGLGALGLHDLRSQDAHDPSIVAQADRIAFYTAADAAAAPAVKTIVGPVIRYSCKFLPTDPNGSETGALQQLRLKALAMGANGIVGVTYQHGGVSLVKNCWDSVTASGTAVIFEAPRGP
ncbi:MAG: heavy metal-binding domain-containing protein [Caulobacteraceae bacterium]